MTRLSLFVMAIATGSSSAFLAGCPRYCWTNSDRVTSSTQLYFGVPDFFRPKDEEKSDAKQTAPAAAEAKKIGLAGVLQLVAAGMGAPFLGDYQGMDKETGKFMFTLEANNLVDENGNSKQTQMPHFENGWVDPDDEGFKFPWQRQQKK
jgi:hypothetical protein